MPSTFPFRCGSTSPIARAAPVDVGIRLIAAARARRRSLCGRSSTCWSFVYAWIVVMKPRSIPNVSSSTFAIGATQFVVHDAFEMIACCSASYWSSFTPSTRVMSGSVAGAEMITFFAPASRCFCADARSVKKPVDSITTSTPRSRQGKLAGSRSASPFRSLPSTFSDPASASTVPLNEPSTESWRSRCAIVGTSPRSLNATISKSASRSCAARKKLRPIRPNPLIPTRVFAMRRLYSSSGRGDPVDRGELLAQVADVGRRVDRRGADDALQCLAGGVLATEAMEVLAQPVAKRRELALLEAVVDVRHVGGDSFPDLGGDQVAERVGREVADGAARPVHVLQHAFGVARHVDAEVLPHAAVPLVRQLFERELLGEHRLLELEAEDDVQVVGRLVRLDADQRRLHDVHLAVPALDVVAAERVRVQLLQAREEVTPERQRAADEVLPHPALRLVHAERHAARERRSLERRVDLVLVQPVPELVHRPEEAAEVVVE